MTPTFFPAPTGSNAPVGGAPSERVCSGLLKIPPPQPPPQTPPLSSPVVGSIVYCSTTSDSGSSGSVKPMTYNHLPPGCAKIPTGVEGPIAAKVVKELGLGV